MKLELDGERVKIRKLKISDAQDIYENAKDEEVTRWMLNIPHPYPRDEARKFIRRTYYRLKKKKGYDFGIVLKNTDEIIGMVSLGNIDWKNKNAEVGYWLGKKYWGKGLIIEAVKLILKFGFGKLKLHRIYAHLFEENIGSKKVLEKCGFKLEAIMREALFKHNKWHNELKYGILEKEYEKTATP